MYNQYLKKNLNTLKEQIVNITNNTIIGGGKGIYVDNSWDKFLEDYYNPKPKRVPKKYDVEPVFHKTMNDIQNEILEYYTNNGYENTRKYVHKLFVNNEISLVTKSQLVSKLTTLQSMPKRTRKWAMKIN